MKARNLFFSLIAIVFVQSARADDCGPGHYYNDNNECVVCQVNHYCPGDGTMQPCPEFTYNNIEDVKPLGAGYNVRSVVHAALNSSASYNNYDMISIERCRLTLFYVEVDEGRMREYRLGYSPIRNAYDVFVTKSWDRANAGYYLLHPFSSPTRWRDIKPCTNSHPANSHYSGPGTPDSADGTIVDANDCPWECDSGYGQTDSGECLQLCQAGVTEFHAGNLMFNIYANKQTTPSINIKYNDTVCYVSLAAGSTTNAVHVKYQDTTYHTIN